MSLHFYDVEEDIPKLGSITDYEYIFKEYYKKTPKLHEELNQMYISTNIYPRNIHIAKNEQRNGVSGEKKAGIDCA